MATVRLFILLFLCCTSSLKAQNPPGNWAATYLSAMKHYNEKDWDSAITLFKTAIKTDPQKRIVYRNLLMTHLLKTRDYSQTRFNSYMQQEIGYFTTLISRQPRFGVFYSARASYYEQVQDYNKAVEDMNTAISCTPQDSLFYLKRGLLYQYNFTDKDELAMADYKKAISLHCTDSTMYRSMDKLYRKTKEKYSLAAALMQLVELTGSKEALPLKLLAKAYEDAGNYVVAGMYYDRAYKIDLLPETLDLVNTMAQKAADDVKANGAKIPEPGKPQNSGIVRTTSPGAGAKSNVQAPKLTPANSSCAMCGGMGKIQKFGSHLAYVPVLDNQGRQLYRNYQTVTEFYYETCSRCGGSGK